MAAQSSSRFGPSPRVYPDSYPGSRARKLTFHPLIGRPMQGIDRPPLRDLFVQFGQAGYWLRYAILIAKIWHGRENSGDGNEHWIRVQ